MRLVFFIVFCFCIAIGCSNQKSENNIPELNAQWDDSSKKISIPVTVATYNWHGQMTYGGPWEATEKQEPTIVKGNATIQLSFSKKNPDEILISEHLNKTEFKNIDKAFNQIIVPDKPGVYVFGVDGTWRNDSVMYALKVKVK
ncbi:hypothetical protein [Paenibacillus kyungheensis]